jgi:hypothetical protein
MFMNFVTLPLHHFGDFSVNLPSKNSGDFWTSSLMGFRRIINGICRWYFVGIQEVSISSSRLAAEVSIPKTFLLVRFPGANKLGMKIFKFF